MKKILRIVPFLSVIILYSSLMSLCSSSLFSQNIDNSKLANDSNQQQYFFSSSSNHNQIAENESLVTTYNSSVNFVTIKDKLSATAKAIEHFFITTYSQYNFYSQYLLILFFPTDIVFPFHYFW